MSLPAVAFLTAIYDSYDVLKPVPPQKGVQVAECVVVTDDPGIADGCPGWRVVCEPRPGVPPMRAAKAAKYRPQEFTDAPASIWMDASVQVISPGLAAAFLAAAEPVATFAHPQRDCVYDEVAASVPMPRYGGEPVAAQGGFYRSAGHPAHWGLWETTIVARRHGPEAVALGEAWAAEMEQWSSQDQVSFPFVLRRLGMRAGVLPGAARGSPWHCWGGSARH